MVNGERLVPVPQSEDSVQVDQQQQEGEGLMNAAIDDHGREFQTPQSEADESPVVRRSQRIRQAPTRYGF